MDCSLPGSSIHGICQARALEWVAISFSRGSSQPRDRTQVSHIAGRYFTFIAVQYYLKKQEKHKIDNLTLHLKQLEKEEQKTPKISRRKEIIKFWAEIHEKEMKEIIVKINKTKSWLFEKINKIDKPLARLIKK